MTSSTTNPFRRHSVKIAPFRFWWSVSWIDEEMVKVHGRGEMELLFKRKPKAEEYARSLTDGTSEEVLWNLARARLS